MRGKKGSYLIRKHEQLPYDHDISFDKAKIILDHSRSRHPKQKYVLILCTRWVVFHKLLSLVQNSYAKGICIYLMLFIGVRNEVRQVIDEEGLNNLLILCKDAHTIGILVSYFNFQQIVNTTHYYRFALNFQFQSDIYNFTNIYDKTELTENILRKKISALHHTIKDNRDVLTL